MIKVNMCPRCGQKRLENKNKLPTTITCAKCLNEIEATLKTKPPVDKPVAQPGILL